MKALEHFIYLGILKTRTHMNIYRIMPTNYLRDFLYFLFKLKNMLRRYF